MIINEDENSLALKRILTENIRKFRKELHLTQEMLAETSDISFSHLADIEHCKTWVSDKTLIKLANALHKEPYELLMPEMATKTNSDSNRQEKNIASILHAQKNAIAKQVKDSYDETLVQILRQLEN